MVYHNADDVVVLKPDEDYESHSDELVEKYDVKSGYWWSELGGDWDDIIKQSEDIRWELYRTVYGVWDHIKNGRRPRQQKTMSWSGSAISAACARAAACWATTSERAGYPVQPHL